MVEWEWIKSTNKINWKQRGKCMTYGTNENTNNKHWKNSKRGKENDVNEWEEMHRRNFWKVGNFWRKAHESCFFFFKLVKGRNISAYWTFIVGLFARSHWKSLGTGDSLPAVKTAKAFYHWETEATFSRTQKRPCPFCLFSHLRVQIVGRVQTSTWLPSTNKWKKKRDILGETGRFLRWQSGTERGGQVVLCLSRRLGWSSSCQSR